MRDLYSRLNVTPSASPEVVERAIAACSDSSVRANATEVLLVPGRRQTYDRVHCVLSDIGQLRGRLGLSLGQHWRGGEVSDFACDDSVSISRSKYDELLRKVQSANNRPDASRSSGSSNVPIARVAGRTARAIAKQVASQPLAWIGGFIVVFILASPYCNGPESTVTTERESDRTTPSYRAPFERPEQVIPLRPAFTPPEQVIPLQPAFTAPELLAPYNGKIRLHTLAERMAPLEIKTSGGGSYLVKLENSSTSEDVLDVFVRGGSTVQIDVPLGSYTIKYASGTKWYGYTHYFGPETSYSKADSTFVFTRHGEQVNGYTITLYRVVHGNLHTSTIAPEDF